MRPRAPSSKTKHVLCSGSCVDVACRPDTLMKGRQHAHDVIRSSRISSRTIQIAATMDEQNKHEVATRGTWGGQDFRRHLPIRIGLGGGLPWTPSCYTSPSSASIYSRGPLRVETRGVGHSPSSSGVRYFDLPQVGVGASPSHPPWVLSERKRLLSH